MLVQRVQSLISYGLSLSLVFRRLSSPLTSHNQLDAIGVFFCLTNVLYPPFYLLHVQRWAAQKHTPASFSETTRTHSIRRPKPRRFSHSCGTALRSSASVTVPSVRSRLPPSSHRSPWRPSTRFPPQATRPVKALHPEA